MHPNLYNALSATSQGFLDTREGKSSPSPQLDYSFSPSPQAPTLPPEFRTNPVVTQSDVRPVNQQPYPQPSPAPTMPGLYNSLIGR